MKIKTTLVVTFQVPGFHYWDSAPEEFYYLRAIHRHLFHFKVYIEVTTDRQIEFIDFGEKCKKLVQAQFLFSPTTASCEKLARALLARLALMSYNVARVECWEDEENGAIVEVVR